MAHMLVRLERADDRVGEFAELSPILNEAGDHKMAPTAVNPSPSSA
jgi:hypothetical protein